MSSSFPNGLARVGTSSPRAVARRSSRGSLDITTTGRLGRVVASSRREVHAVHPSGHLDVGDDEIDLAGRLGEGRGRGVGGLELSDLEALRLEHPAHLLAEALLVVDNDCLHGISSGWSSPGVGPSMISVPVRSLRTNVATTAGELALGLPVALPADGPAVLWWSGHDERYRVPAAQAGGSGYVSKRAGFEELVSAIRRVAVGQTTWLLADLRALRNAPTRPTARELEVLSGVAAGRPSKEIAADLGLVERTVESHLRRMFDRYGVSNRIELTNLARRNGWT